MLPEELKQNITVYGPLFPEPVQVIMAVPMGTSVKLIGKGVRSNTVYDPILGLEQLAQLTASPVREPFDGDATKFRLGVEAMRLGLAYEYDPYFSLSIARVDPLPHQLEAVYDYFMKLPRIRFLLADDPGAGKTIMAGLLIKELKIRGLVKRTLIVTPANLSFQWQREMKDKFRENFEIIRSDVLRANYGTNPWQEKNQVITSVSWVSRIEDAKETLLRSHWDLIIVDEAHKMSADSADKKTLAYPARRSPVADDRSLSSDDRHAAQGRPGEFLPVPVTARQGRLWRREKPGRGDGEARGAVLSSPRQGSPGHFPGPETGKVKALFTKRIVQTTAFQINDEELDFYDALTRYVEDQSIKAAREDSARGRALGFTMAMLQRRFASSIYAVRRSLERMKEKREHILDDPEGTARSRSTNACPTTSTICPTKSSRRSSPNWKSWSLPSTRPTLRDEIAELGKLIHQAQILEKQEAEVKVVDSRNCSRSKGIFDDPKMKLLIFTEHKDTLDFLVATARTAGRSANCANGA